MPMSFAWQNDGNVKLLLQTQRNGAVEGGVAEARVGEERELSAEAKRARPNRETKRGWLQERASARAAVAHGIEAKAGGTAFPLGCSSMVVVVVLSWRRAGWDEWINPTWRKVRVGAALASLQGGTCAIPGL